MRRKGVKRIYGREAFGKLLEMLVGSVLLYGVEVWGCGRQLRPIEEVQMRVVRIFFFGGGRGQGCTH